MLTSAIGVVVCDVAHDFRMIFEQKKSRRARNKIWKHLKDTLYGWIEIERD